jgi:hypothetical protein
MRATEGRRDVLPLAFHVTYWDRLGWKDPFSLEAATERQDRYGHRFFGLLNFFVDFIGCQVSRRPNRLLLALNASVVLPIRSTVDIDAALRLPLPPVLLGAFVVPDERIKICA